MELEPPPESRCVVHGDVRATNTCAECYSHVCPECMPHGLELGQICVICDSQLARQSAGKSRVLIAVLTVLLAIQVALDFADIGVCLYVLEVFGDYAELGDEAIKSLGSFERWLAGSYNLIYFVTCIMWCVWFWRVTTGLKARQIELSFGRHAYFWYLVPFVQWYKPYAHTKELYYKATDKIDVPIVFPIWWTCWIGAIFAGRIVEKLFKEDSGDFDTALWWTVVENGLLIVAAIAAIVLLRTIQAEIARAASVRVRRLPPGALAGGFRKSALVD